MAQFKEIDDINFPFEVGILPNRELAYKVADYLNSKGIKATAKPGFSNKYSVYVANEADISKAKIEILRFGENPFAKQYNQAAWQSGRTIKREKVMNGGFLSFSMGNYRWSLFSITSLIEVACILVYVLTLIPSFERGLHDILTWSNMQQVTENFEVYRVVTPIFLHFGLLHIAFNLVMFEVFARPIERYFGSLKIISLIVTLAIVSNALEVIFLPDTAIFGGMSGVVYGLIAYIAVLSRRSDLPSELRVPRGLLVVSMIMIAIGFLLASTANFCHLGGLVLGLVLGFMDYKRPLKR